MWNGVRVDPTRQYSVESKYWTRMVDDAGVSYVVMLFCGRS